MFEQPEKGLFTFYREQAQLEDDRAAKKKQQKLQAKLLRMQKVSEPLVIVDSKPPQIQKEQAKVEVTERVKTRPKKKERTPLANKIGDSVMVANRDQWLLRERECKAKLFQGYYIENRHVSFENLTGMGQNKQMFTERKRPKIKQRYINILQDEDQDHLRLQNCKNNSWWQGNHQEKPVKLPSIRNVQNQEEFAPRRMKSTDHILPIKKQKKKDNKRSEFDEIRLEQSVAYVEYNLGRFQERNKGQSQRLSDAQQRLLQVLSKHRKNC